MRSHALLGIAIGCLLPVACVALVSSESQAQAQTTCERPAIEPCTTRHGRFSTQNGIAQKLWLIGTTRKVNVTNAATEFLPSGVLKYTEMTSPDHSYIFGDFTICPIEPDILGHMRDVCVTAAKNLVVQSVTSARPPFRVLSTWFHSYEHTGPPEVGPMGLSCDADTSAIRNSMFELEVGRVQLHDGKGSTTAPDSLAQAEWSIELKRAERWGPSGRFLLLVVTADHLTGSGSADSVFVYACRGNQLSRVLWAKREYGADVQTAGSTLSITSGAWGPRDPHCCPSFERVERFAWNEKTKRFTETSSRVTPLKQ
jgi:hypothetical protein